MASKYQARSYNDATLAALEHALRDVWEVLKAHNPDGDWENELIKGGRGAQGEQV